MYPSPLCLSNVGQVVRIVPPSLVPSESSNQETKADTNKLSNHLEVVDISQNSAHYLALPHVKNRDFYTKWKTKEALIDSLSNDVIVSVSPDGSIRLWETGTSDLQKSFSEWKTLVGNESSSLQVRIKKCMHEIYDGACHLYYENLN
jgi:hypothetical protein